MTGSAFLLLLWTTVAVAGIITVDDDGTANFDNIQAAIDDANDFDTVIVADGTYTGPGNRDLDFLGKAITVRSANGPENCIIDPNGTAAQPHRGFYFHSGESADSVVEGFTITNGYATKGGGICCINDSSPTIINCNITGNTAIGAYPNGGGGVYCYNFEGSPTISHCVITNNSGGYGSGIFWLGDGTISYCTISDNIGLSGEYTKGGGVYTDSFSCTITYCAITDNTAMSGGGIYCWGTEPVISHCSITNNVATGTDFYEGGGGMKLETAFAFVDNCVIANNSAYRGGGIYSEWCNEATVTNCTITGNLADIGGGYCDESSCLDSISNCIFWNNTALGGSEIEGWAAPGTVVEYSDVQGGYSGTGNIDADPLFVDPNGPDGIVGTEDDNLCLLPCSPCIDAGDNSVVDPNDTDLDGNPRIVNDTVDMGAYEFQGIINIIYVDMDAAGANDGSSWADAYTSLPYALDVASCGDEIRVAQGTYRPDRDSNNPNGSGDRYATFQLVSGVAVKGGYAGYGEAYPNARDVGAYETILSGDLSGDDVGDPDPEDPSRDDNSYHVVTGSGTDATAVLDGFTVTAGNDPYAGGGMYNNMGSPTVTSCVFSANSAYFYGNGMYNTEDSNPTLTNCSFIGNSGGGAGGGMCNINSSPILTNCTFSGNSAPGIFISEGGGGGMYNSGSSPTLTNCIFNGNSAGRGGGGMSNYYNSSPTLTNCTFNGNSALIGGGMESAHESSPILTNCILWGDTPDEILVLDGPPIVTYCDVEGDWPGEGNIDADPLFVDPNGPDGIVGTEDDSLRLSPGSPCIDAGDNSVVDPNSTDLDGNPRIVNGIVDMGAYEFQYIIHVDDDAPNDPGPGDPDVSDPGENGTEAHPFDTIQEAIDVALNGHTVLVWPGLYPTSDPYEGEAFNFLGKNITLTSTDPADPNKTIIGGTVLFSGTENSDCTFTGFRIHDLSFGAIYGNHTHATISHCILSGNGPCGATVVKDCDGLISNCLITDNITVFLCGVYPVVFGCHGVIKNCTIANNASGVSVLDGAETTIENSIIYYNDESFTHQVSVGNGGTVNILYCDVQGGLEGILGDGTVNWGPGNINTDPCFVRLGYWGGPLVQLIEGDYHLKSEGWRWRGFLFHGSYWTYDYVTSRCIDAANPGSPLLDEVMTALPDDPDNEWGINLRRNMGAYGGTAGASMPPYGWALLADLTNDGVVNLVDFAGQALDWLASGTEQPGDLNRDSIVDITDTAMVAEDWLEVTDWAQ